MALNSLAWLLDPALPEVILALHFSVLLVNILHV